MVAGIMQIRILAFVLPSKKSKFCYIRPAPSPDRFWSVPLKPKTSAGRIVFIRRWMSDQLAQIEEVLLVGLFFACSGTPPLADEILRCDLNQFDDRCLSWDT